MNSEEKNSIVKQLREGEVVVKFTKVNGDERTMTCTLQPSVLPITETTENTRKSNPDVCSVWDVNAKGWRSFRWENVIEVNTND